MTDYLTDEEQVDRLKRLWKEWGLVVVLALVVGIGGTVGMDFYESHQSTRAEEASELYSSYLEAKGLGEPSTIYVEEITEEFGSSAYFVFTMLQEAKTAADDADFEQALISLKDAQEAADGSPIADLVTLRRARVEFELEQYDAVLSTLTTIETVGFRWRALMLKGDVHFKRDELDSAREAYEAARDSIPFGVNTSDIDMRVASVPAAE